MHVVSYRYRVPRVSQDDYVRLQERLAAIYLGAGCERYLILRPTAGSDEWQELAWFRDQRHAEEVEAAIEPQLEPLFEEFKRLTALSESQLRQLRFEEAVHEGATANAG